jgi:hypothetical protein
MFARNTPVSREDGKSLFFDVGFLAAFLPPKKSCGPEILTFYDRFYLTVILLLISQNKRETK